MNVSEFHDGSHESSRPRSRHAFQYGFAWLILVVVLSGLSAQKAPNAAPVKPRLEFESEKIDLGELDRGKVVTARFTARNVSDQPVRIQKVKPG
jgi:hypothetical protein